MAEPIQGGQTAGTAGTAGATGQQDALGMQNPSPPVRIANQANQYCFVAIRQGR